MRKSYINPETEIITSIMKTSFLDLSLKGALFQKSDHSDEVIIIESGGIGNGKTPDANTYSFWDDEEE